MDRQNVVSGSHALDAFREPEYVGEAAAEEDEISLIDLLIVLAKHKWMIIGLPLVLALIASGISLTIPNTYKSAATILPPQQSQSGAAALLSQLGGAAAGMAGVKNPNDLYVGMLKSRTLADNLVQRFDLAKVYDVKSLEAARNALGANTIVNAGKGGLISVEVFDREPARAAELANAYVDELLGLNTTLALTEASQRRLFFERQLESAKDSLAQAEASLKVALDTQGVISVDSESRAMVETMARLRAQIAGKEIQLNSIQAFVTPNNQDFKRHAQELKSLRAELYKLENGRPGASGGVEGEKVALDSIKILRDVKYFEMLYELLAKQYEIARLDEAKDASIVQVLDKAVAPERKAKPRRAMIVIAVAFLGLAIAMVLAFLMEANEKALRRPEYADRLKMLKGYMGLGGAAATADPQPMLR